MYDQPFAPGTTAGAVLALAVGVLLVVRAVRVELCAPARTTVQRAADVGLDALLGLAVIALLAVLTGVVLAGLGG